MSEAHGEMQTKLGDLIKEAGKVGLTINIKKTKALTLEALVVLHYLEAPTAVKLTGVCFIASLFISC